MTLAYHMEFGTAAEHRLLIAELDHVRSEWPIEDRLLATILGLDVGSVATGLQRPLPRDAEAQVRRLLEVTRLATLLMGERGAREWFTAPDAVLDHSTPARTVQRPGGLSYVRDLLRDAWEEADPFGRLRDGYGWRDPRRGSCRVAPGPSVGRTGVWDLSASRGS